MYDCLFLQSKIELFVNRLDSVETVIPYEYSRFVSIVIYLFIYYENKNTQSLQCGLAIQNRKIIIIFSLL